MKSYMITLALSLLFLACKTEPKQKNNEVIIFDQVQEYSEKDKKLFTKEELSIVADMPIEKEWIYENFQVHYTDLENVLVLRAKKTAVLSNKFFIHIYPLDIDKLEEQYRDQKNYPMNFYWKDRRELQGYYYYFLKLPVKFDIKRFHIRQWNIKSNELVWDTLLYVPYEQG